MSVKRGTSIKLGVGAAAVAILSLVIASFSLPVFAKDDTIAKKAALYGVYKTCYKGNNMVTPIRSDEFRDVWSLAKDEGSFTLPTGWYNEHSASCLQLIQNTYMNADFKGIASMDGVAIPNGSSGVNTINSFLEGMGYTKTTAAGGKCASFSYLHDNGGDPDVTTMCANVDSQGRITSDQVTVSYSDGVGVAIELELDTPGEIDLDCNTNGPTHGGCTTHKFTKGETKFSDLVGSIYADLQENRSSAVCDPFSAFKKCWRLQPGAPITDQGEVKASFKIDNSTSAGDKAVKYLSKNAYANSNALKLSEKERITLLQDYMQNYYKVQVYGCNIKGDDADIAKGAGYLKVKTSLKSSDGGFQECWVKPTQNNNNSVAAYNSSFFFDGTMMDFGAVVKALNKAAKNQKEDNTAVDPSDGGTVEPSGGEEPEEEVAPCSTAAASLGWIICPVVQALSKAVDGIYGYIEDNYLQLNNSYVSNTSGTKSGWETFRNLANIVFVIVLAIIILSQITGFGVNNYGIKKMLPSLIIVAVLVNISFFLCQIAVDVSNIMGYGIKDTFDGINVTMGNINLDGADKVGIGPLISSIIPTLLSGGALFAGIAIAATTWELWIMPFLLLLIITVIGILFFFILLGVRQAGIIILIALAPVAIICYALPNTKNIFSRWWKMFSALLLVYPICGALMGGGHFASKLLLSNITASSNEGTTVFYTFVAILIQVVPFFFIPSILRSSFQAIGNLGNRLSMLGSRLGRSTTGAIRRSERYKDSQGRLAATNAQRALRRSESERGLWGVRNRIGARMRSGNNRASRALDNSYQRRQARRVNAVAGQRMADQNARFVAANGLAAAERRQNDDMMKSYESNYKSDLGFMNNLDAQETAYSNAIDAVDADPTNQDSIAQLRALQNVLGSMPDGQDRIQRVINRKLYEAQASAPAGTSPTLSAGMQTASQTLMNDHGGFKSGNRGLNATLKDMNSGKVFSNGTFTRTQVGTDANSNPVYSYNNAHYGAQAAKGSASELANANDDTLRNLLGSVGSMNNKQLADIYRNASEAITNDNIAVKPENEDMLNQIRQAAYGRMQANAAGSTSYHDDQGRTFMNTGGNNYQYTDASGATHNFTRDATTGNFTEVGGAGEVINSSNMMTASENFTSSYGGNYRDLHASDEFKVSHEPARRKIEMPPGWMRNSAGTWINSRDGFRNLTPDEVRRAEQYEAHNIQVDIDNDTRR